MIKTFVSYHHANDQEYKNQLVNWATSIGLIDDISVNTGEIDENLEPQAIRRIIRDNYLRDSEVTILLCGTETRFRKHVDWELKSSMINGSVNRQSGILVIDLPTTSATTWSTAFGQAEKELIYPDYTGSWTSISTVAEYEDRYREMPRRIIENKLKPNVKISIVPWDRVYGYANRLEFLLSETRKAGPTNEYDLGRKMRMRNFNPSSDAFDFRV